VALLDLLVTANLGREADVVPAAEGWKWKEAHLDFPRARHAANLPHPVWLSAKDQAALTRARTASNG
jgi:ParB family chromosome partitioning protein